MSALARRILAMSACAVISACTLEPHYERPAAPVPALPVGDPDGAAAVSVGWQQFFPDPQLQRLISLALASNRDLRIAALNVQSAQAHYRIQRAELLPTISASALEEIEEFPNGVLGSSSGAGGGVATGQPTSSGGTTLRFYDVGIGFTSYELDFFGRIRSLNHAALQEYFAADASRRSAQLTLVAEVAAAYLAVLADQTLLDITRDTLRNQRDSFEKIQRMLSAGTTTELALRQAESTVDTARVNLAQYQRQLALDLDALQVLLGAPIPENVDFSAGLDRETIVAELAEGIPADVLVQRPDVLAVEHQLRAANAEIGAARAAFFPSITLTGSFGTASTDLSGLFKAGSRTWTFSPQISIPLFAGGANVANLQATKITRAAVLAQYEKTIQTAFREVADALASREALNDQLEAQEALVTASSGAYQLSEMRYRGGVDNYLSALDAQRSLYGAQQQLQLVRLLRLQNLVTLYKALGGGLLERSHPSPSTAPAT